MSSISPRSSALPFPSIEVVSGLLLLLFATLAVVIANSPYQGIYENFLQLPIAIKAGYLSLEKPLLLWINDGLMAIFFFLIGLELKREIFEGELSSIQSIIFPGIGAIGGMVIPACIYLAFNFNDPLASQGWAIPTATDIAFALGVLALLGSRIPSSAKIFLTSLAVFDDIGAILIIALFYTEGIATGALIITALCVFSLFILNYFHITSRSMYIFVGLIMWAALLKSGVHATLAGVLLALFIPFKSKNPQEISPLKRLEKDLHASVTFIILPLFALANAGVNFKNLSIDSILHPIPVGVFFGLLIGKQLGVFGCCWCATKLKLCTKPKDISWATLYGLALICGIGFTMSLFIGSLAFDARQLHAAFDERTGILVGSLLSGIAGFFVIFLTSSKKHTAP